MFFLIVHLYISYTLLGCCYMKLIAHRANDNHNYFENTKEAVEECLKKDYISGIEIDVRMTKDKKIVVLHDYTISRVSNGFGIVKNMTLKDLQKYNFGNQKHKSKINTLDAILKKVKEYNSDKLIILDIKMELDNIKEIGKSLLKIINKYKKINLLIMSFNTKILKYLKKKCEYKLGKAYLIDSDIFQYEYDAYFIRYKYYKKYDIKKPIFYWTVNKKDFIEKNKQTFLIKDYIITDKAAYLSRFM